MLRKLNSALRVLLSEMENERKTFNDAHEEVCSFFDLTVDEGEILGEMALTTLENFLELELSSYDFSLSMPIH